MSLSTLGNADGEGVGVGGWEEVCLVSEVLSQ